MNSLVRQSTSNTFQTMAFHCQTLRCSFSFELLSRNHLMRWAFATCPQLKPPQSFQDAVQIIECLCDSLASDDGWGEVRNAGYWTERMTGWRGVWRSGGGRGRVTRHGLGSGRLE